MRLLDTEKNDLGTKTIQNDTERDTERLLDTKAKVRTEKYYTK